MQNNYSSYTPRGIPQNNPGAGFYPTATPPDLRFYDWQYGPSMHGNKSNCYLPADFQRPPCQTFLGTRSSGVPHPVNYPNFNILSCGDYPNPQLDRDYRQAFGREFEQGYVEQQTPRNSDQGDCRILTTIMTSTPVALDHRPGSTQFTIPVHLRIKIGAFPSQLLNPKSLRGEVVCPATIMAIVKGIGTRMIVNATETSPSIASVPDPHLQAGT